MKISPRIQLLGLLLMLIALTIIVFTKSLVSTQILVARAEMSSSLGTSGYVFIIDYGERVNIVGRLKGLKPDGVHGFHIHTNGNITGGCDSTGPHYNPKNVTHGAPNNTVSLRHVGDLGNIIANDQGVVNISITDSFIKLSGIESVLGRAFVVHAGRDDLGLGGNATSIANGNDGSRVACGIIKQMRFSINKSSQLGINQLMLFAFVLIANKLFQFE